MNKIKYLIFTMCLSFVFISGVNANELKLTSTVKDVLEGDALSVKLAVVTGDDGLNLGGCNVSIETDDVLSFQEVKVLNSWSIISKNVNGNVLELNLKNYQSNLYGESNIADIKYLVNGTGNIRITSGACYDDAGNILDGFSYGEDLKINVAVPQAAELKSLNILEEELNPGFSPNVRSYSINNFDGDSISIEYELADDTYENQVQVLVNNRVVTDLYDIPYELVAGNKAMLVTINIGDSSSYNIFVKKTLEEEYEEYIQSITVNGTAIELEDGRYDYSHVVNDEVTIAEVAVELFDTDTFELSSLSNGPGNFSMPGIATVVLDVVPKDSTSGIPSATYTLTITNESYVAGAVVDKNPPTADTSMYVVLGILITSLIASMFIYKKNLEGYE